MYYYVILLTALVGGTMSQECLSLRSSGSFCGPPPLTSQQLDEIESKREMINRIREIGRPIYEGSPEAIELGLSLNNLVVNTTDEQNNYYRRCYPETPEVDTGGRRKRQQNDGFCCRPDAQRVALLATVNGRGVPVQLNQNNIMVDDARNCLGSNDCSAIACRPRLVESMVRLSVYRLVLGNMAGIANERVMIDVCGAAPGQP